jgi:5-(carboxyamino)imidazole ribonucleotide synthase
MSMGGRLPIGATIGIIGGGQLGRMLALAAAPLGYKVHIYSPEEAPCAAEVSAYFTRSAYDDAQAVAAFAAQCDVVTFEFENVPVAALISIGEKLRPSVQALHIAQDRANEKDFAGKLNVQTAAWVQVDTLEELTAALKAIGTPAILKTRRLGYDGKGQVRIGKAEEAPAAFEALRGHACILEGHVRFSHEFSVIAVRGLDGGCAFYEACENAHEGGILRTTHVPAAPAIQAAYTEARAIARRVLEKLDYYGVLALEFFVGTQGLVFNEMAPRVHNSGHWTIEGAETSQFENHIRAICGLPLGSTRMSAKSLVMRNIIGEEVQDVEHIFKEQGAHLHLYGKGAALPGRKMGHSTNILAR